MDSRNTVEFFVEYLDFSGKDVIYAEVYKGFKTRKYLYLQRKRETHKKPTVEYVKVRKRETTFLDKKHVRSVVAPRQYREIKLPYGEELPDSFFESVTDEKIKKKIDTAAMTLEPR